MNDLQKRAILALQGLTGSELENALREAINPTATEPAADKPKADTVAALHPGPLRSGAVPNPSGTGDALEDALRRSVGLTR